MKTKTRILLAGSLTSLLLTGLSSAVQVRVTVQSNAPSNGVALTPVWVGFHDGSFDSYNGGLTSQPGLESLAEDGSTMQISNDFAADLTYVSGGVSTTTASGQVGTRVQGTLNGVGPITSGESTSQIFDISSGANRYFSYASMVLPSNDYYVANGDPTIHDLLTLLSGPNGTQISFNIGTAGTVNDAGTEVNDFATSAANGLFPGRGLGSGQAGVPDTGADQGGVNTNVANAFDFAAMGQDVTGFDFNDTNLYPNGIATITLEVIPEPSSALLLSFAGLGLVARRRR